MLEIYFFVIPYGNSAALFMNTFKKATGRLHSVILSCCTDMYHVENMSF